MHLKQLKCLSKSKWVYPYVTRVPLQFLIKQYAKIFATCVTNLHEEINIDLIAATKVIVPATNDTIDTYLDRLHSNELPQFTIPSFVNLVKYSDITKLGLKGERITTDANIVRANDASKLDLLINGKLTDSLIIGGGKAYVPIISDTHSIVKNYYTADSGSAVDNVGLLDFSLCGALTTLELTKANITPLDKSRPGFAVVSIHVPNLNYQHFHFPIINGSIVLDSRLVDFDPQSSSLIIQIPIISVLTDVINNWSSNQKVVEININGIADLNTFNIVEYLTNGKSHIVSIADKNLTYYYGKLMLTGNEFKTVIMENDYKDSLMLTENRPMNYRQQGDARFYILTALPKQHRLTISNDTVRKTGKNVFLDPESPTVVVFCRL